MTAVRLAYRRLLAGLGLFAGVLIGAIAVLVTVDVALRNLGLGNLPWLLEGSEYALYIATFAAAPWVLSLGAHVRVDVVVNALPPRLQWGVERAVDLVGLAISLVLLYFSFAATSDAARLGSLIFKQLVLAEWWLLAVMPLSALLLSTEFALRLVAPGGPPPRSGAETIEHGF